MLQKKTKPTSSSNQKLKSIFLKSLWFICIACLILFTITIIFNFLTIPIPYHSWPSYILDNRWSDILSLTLAIIALIIAFITYHQIDNVQNVTSMDGNVLENPNYSVSYHEILRHAEAYGAAPEDYIQHYKNDFWQKSLYKSLDSIQLADALQRIIDNTFLNAYCSIPKEEFANLSQQDIPKAIESCIKQLEKQKDKLEKTSNHLQHVLGEHIKLIHYIWFYQIQNMLSEEEKEKISIRDIRGSMIINPVAQINYYNYLGLDCFTEARNIIDTLVPTFDHEPSTPDAPTKFKNQLRKIQQLSEKEVAKDTIRLEPTTADHIRHIEQLLEEAATAFRQANKIVKTLNDKIWYGYTTYNLARVYAYQYAFAKAQKKPTKITKEIVKNYMDKACLARQDIILFLAQKDTYLYTRFVQECEYAYFTRNIFEAFDKEPTPNTNSVQCSAKTDFEAVDKEPTPNTANAYDVTVQDELSSKNYSITVNKK